MADYINRLLIGILYLHIDFLAVYRDFTGSADAQLHLFAFDLQHRDLHVIVDHQRFVLFSG